MLAGRGGQEDTWGNMADVDASHSPTEQIPINDEHAGSGGVFDTCRSDCNPTNATNTNITNITECLGDPRDAHASRKSAITVSLAAVCVGNPPAGTRTDPLDPLVSENMSVDHPCDVRRLPVSGNECGDVKVEDDQWDNKDNFTEPLIQPRKLSYDTSVAEPMHSKRDHTYEKSEQNDSSNGLEVDSDGLKVIGNGVDSQRHRVGARGKPVRSSLQCEHCGKSFTRRETLDLHRHSHAHNDPAPLTCKQCGLNFQDRSSFIKHRKVHKDEEEQPLGSNKDAATCKGRRFNCANCSKLFSTVEKLRWHNCNKSPDKPYHCPLCRREFQFKVAIPKHMQIHSLENVYQCQECDAHFSDGPTFHAHQRSHAALKPYGCPECSMVFKHYSVMEDHRRRHTENTPSHHCSVCGKTFKYGSLLHQHQYLHTGQKPFCCPACGKKFAFAQNMKAHYRQHRPSATTSPVPPDQPSKPDPVPIHDPLNRLGKENTDQSVQSRRVYNCPLCALKFTAVANLRAHMLIHEAEHEKGDAWAQKETKPLEKTLEKVPFSKVCPHCPSIFHNKLSYYGHLLRAHRCQSQYLEQVAADQCRLLPNLESQKKVLKCQHCSRMFAQRRFLQSHMRVHDRDGRYKCSVCGKSFRCHLSLRQHFRLHRTEKPYKCPVCGKGFPKLRNMKTHLKLHQKKPFHCSTCGNFYLDAAQLQQHMLSHKGPKKHKCNFCEKTFSTLGCFRDHMNTHRGVRSHCCAVCNRRFFWLSSLNVHMKTHEGRLAASPVSSSANVAAQPPGDTDTESGQNAFQTQAPMLSAQIDTKKQPVEPCLSDGPVQWKVSGGEILPVSLAQPLVLSLFDVSTQHQRNLLKSISDPSAVPSLETSHMKDSSVLISGSLQPAMPTTVTPSIVGQVETHRQSQPETQRGRSTAANVASNSSAHQLHVSSAYVDQAALWSVKPHPVTSTSQVSPRKQESPSSPTKDYFNPHTAVTSTMGQSEKRVNGGERQKQWSPSLSIVSASAQLDQIKAVLSTPASLEVCSTLWDKQTPPGIPKTSSPSDQTGGNQEFQLQQKQQPGLSNQTSPEKVPMSLPYQPHHLAPGLVPAVWAFPVNQVSPQALLPGHIKPGNTQELQHQPMVTGTPIILNQASPFFSPPLAPLPLPLALPGPRPLHSVAALPRPPYPTLFFAPQAVMSPHMSGTLPLPLPQLGPQTGPHNLGVGLPFAPEGLLQCRICGRTLPREMDLEIHYLKHAKGEI